MTTCQLCDDGVPLVILHGERLHEFPDHPDLITCTAHPTQHEYHTIPLVYIMSPYTDPDPEVMEQRYALVQYYEQLLTVKFPKALFYSPIAHFHPIALVHDLPRDIDYWRDKNRCMIHRSQLGILLCIEGWKDSEGILWECELFNTLHIPYVLSDPAPTSEHEAVGQALQELA